MKKIGFLTALSCLCYSSASFAWSWQLGIVNNLDIPLNYKFDQHNSGNAWPEDGIKNEGFVQAHDTKTFELTTGGTFNKTTDGVLHIWNTDALNCYLRYYQASIYSAHNLGTWQLEGDSNSPQCFELFLSDTDASRDGWNPIDLIFNAVKFPRLTKGQEQCSGIDNCVVANPPKYTTQWAVDNINRQTRMGDHETLNVGQMFGTHNSIISRAYTNESEMTNMSYSDPNQYISVMDQLKLGVRQFEFDFLDNDDNFQICHFRVDDKALVDFAKMFVCSGNYMLSFSLNEINNWLRNNPDELIYIYLDNIREWNANKIELFNQMLVNIFGQKVLSKTDVSSDSLPVNTLTRHDIIHTLKKNVVLYGHNKDSFFTSSPYFFVTVPNNKTAELPYDVSISDFSIVQQSCDYDKSCFNASLFPNDTEHLSIHVIREDRTHLQQAKGSNQNSSVYLTNYKIKNVMHYPINIVSLDKLSLNDHRLPSIVWSFDYPYPLPVNAGGEPFAFIDPVSGKFSNKQLAETTFNVLCYNNKKNEWFVVNDAVSNQEPFNLEMFKQTAKDSCMQFENSFFATPVTGYQLKDILKLKIIQKPTLINYTFDAASNAWITNEKTSMKFSLPR